jgi:membrane protein DedA with SNARE-associated domain
MTAIVALLIEYKYLVLFPIMVAEGPFASIVSGFLISTGILNVFATFLVVLAGDLAGDAMFYSLGRWSKKYLLKYGIRFNVTEEKLEIAKKYFIEHHHRAILTSKLLYGIGVAGLMAAGTLKIPFYKYIRSCFFISLAQSSILIFLGYVSGYAYSKVFGYLDTYTKIISGIVFIIIILYLFNQVKKKQSKRLK